jgi:hypothetical protein
MDRPAKTSRDEQIEAERKLLTALCQSTLDAHMRATILRRLQEHIFVEPDYDVIYRALAAMPEVGSADIRETLARAVTRLGFPDVDFDSLFNAALPSPAEVEGLLESL